MPDGVRDLYTTIDQRVSMALEGQVEMVRGTVQTVDAAAFRLSAYLDGADTVTPGIAYTSGIGAPIAGDEVLVIRREDGYHLAIALLATTENAKANNISVIVGSVDAIRVDVTDLQADVSGLQDWTAPATPTGLVLSSELYDDGAGGGYPVIVATWDANSEPDLDHYELEYDGAITSQSDFTATASGTGGSLPAGDYAVIVTGEGNVSGETGGDEVNVQTVTVAAGQRLYVDILATPGVTTYRVYASILSGETVPKYAMSTTTTGSDVEVTAAGTGAYPPAGSTALGWVAPRGAYSSALTYQTPIDGGRFYGARIRALDVSGNASDWSTVVTTTTTADTDAPAIPTGLTVNAGYKLLGLRWDKESIPDLRRYEVRYTREGAPGFPDQSQWESFHTTGTIAIIDGLTEDITYYVQVRAVDRSGNVRTSQADSTAVPALANPDAGWSDDGTDQPHTTGVPTLIGAADVAFNSVVTGMLSTGTLEADSIVGGTLTVGGSASAVSYLIVKDAGSVELLRIDQYGLIAVDPTATNKAMRYWKGSLQFSDAYTGDPSTTTWTTALSADGLVADVIKLGSQPGGHNMVPNSGFELSPYAVEHTTTWTTTADFGASIGTPINVTATGDTLQMTSST